MKQLNNSYKIRLLRDELYSHIKINNLTDINLFTELDTFYKILNVLENI